MALNQVNITFDNNAVAVCLSVFVGSSAGSLRKLRINFYENVVAALWNNQQSMRFRKRNYIISDEFICFVSSPK